MKGGGDEAERREGRESRRNTGRRKKNGKERRQDRRVAEPQTRGRNREERWVEEGSKVLACLAPHSTTCGLCNNFGEFHQKREATALDGRKVVWGR